VIVNALFVCVAFMGSLYDCFVCVCVVVWS